jgi:hypothetical protein
MWHKNVSNAASERRQLADFVDRYGGGTIGAAAIAELPAFNKHKRVPLRLCLEHIRHLKKNNAMPVMSPEATL